MKKNNGISNNFAIGNQHFSDPNVIAEKFSKCIITHTANIHDNIFDCNNHNYLKKPRNQKIMFFLLRRIKSTDI